MCIVHLFVDLYQKIKNLTTFSLNSKIKLSLNNSKNKKKFIIITSGNLYKSYFSKHLI